MNNKIFDVIVAKEFSTQQNGKPEKRTVWNKVGRAWPSKNGDSLSFELFLLPNYRYVVKLKDKESQEQTSEEAPF